MRRISFLFATILSLSGINATPRSSSAKNNHSNIDFPADTNDIVFYAQCRNPLNDRNKGRLSIGKMLVEYW